MTTTPTEPAGEPGSGRPPAPVGRIVAIVLGAIAIIIGLVLGGGGGVLTWAHATQRDSDGFFTTSSERLETTTHAITSDEIDLGARPGREDRRFDIGDLATVRIRSSSTTGDSVFVGIGPQDAVEDYFAGVARAEITDIDFAPLRVEYEFLPGDRAPAPPGDEDFWVASAAGPGTQTLEWELESGRYVAVIMNESGRAGVSVETSVGVKAEWVLALGVGLLVGGLALLIVGALVLTWGVVGLARRHSAAPAAVAAGVEPEGAAVLLDARLDEPLHRALWLVKWFLAIPHYFVLAILWVAFAVTTVVAWFAILFSGRYPRGIFDFNVGVLRWSWRVGSYAFSTLGTDRYPPFSLAADDDYPADLHIEYPQRLSRGLIFVKSWLLAFPHWVVVGILVGALALGGAREPWFAVAGGLVSVLVVIAAVALAFTGRYPPAIFDLVVGCNRWVLRVVAYAALMRDEYPPFRLDQGGVDPGHSLAAASPPRAPVTSAASTPEPGMRQDT